MLQICLLLPKRLSITFDFLIILWERFIKRKPKNNLYFELLLLFFSYNEDVSLSPVFCHAEHVACSSVSQADTDSSS